MKILVVVALIVIAIAPAWAAINVSSPANNATVGSPAHFTGWANSVNPITGMRIYVDGANVFGTNSATLDAWVPMSPGWHSVWVKAWDSTGAIQQWGMGVVVGGGAAPALAAPTAGANRRFNDIDQMAGWEHCTTCAGAGGNGPVATFGLAQYISSPSLDGKSAQFYVGGRVPYSNALWWKQLGGNNGASHFVYDLYFYLTTPQVAQALEFDVNQSTAGYRHIFGVQCNIRGNGQWDVWDGTGRTWRATGAACPMPAAYTWHHLTEEFQRGPHGQATFVAITLDGAKHYINRTYQSIGYGGSEVNVAFQMDGDYAQHGYNVWLDRVSLTAW